LVEKIFTKRSKSSTFVVARIISFLLCGECRRTPATVRAVSQGGGQCRQPSGRRFELIVHTARGNRPSFSEAAPPQEAKPLYEAFCQGLRDLGIEVATGEFGARMQLELVNDGPVTIVLDLAGSGG
jgi:D-tyrosyl-tRNA(Tyr) deacylase